MRNRNLTITAVAIAASALAMARHDTKPQPEPRFTSDFQLERTRVFLPSGETAYFSLQPGQTMTYRSTEEGVDRMAEVTALRTFRPIMFAVKGSRSLALARVIEEREYLNGELVEVSENYYARCPSTGNIYNFGEDVRQYDNGRVVGRSGSWLAGRKGAMPGLLMPKSFLLGARYCQGMAPGVSMDRAEHVEMGVTVQTPAGRFEDCIAIVETTPLEPDEQCISVYAPGVGMIVDDSMVLTSTTRTSR